MALMTGLTAKTGFTRLLGLGHLPWVPVRVWIFLSLDQHPSGALFGLWLRALLVVDGLSLALDAVDVLRYLAGDRQETVPGL